LCKQDGNLGHGLLTACQYLGVADGRGQRQIARRDADRLDAVCLVCGLCHDGVFDVFIKDTLSYNQILFTLVVRHPPTTAIMTPKPLHIAMHPNDNVAIVANDGGLPAGTVFPSGLTLLEHVPQGHKVALLDLAANAVVRRYNVPIGYAIRAIPAGSWVNERLLTMPDARELTDLPMATTGAVALPPLEGYTFEGYRNADGSVGTRNILAITQTVQCVAGVTDFAVQRIKAELLPLFPNVDDVVALAHGYGCGVAIDAPDAPIPIRTLRNISLNPNFGGEVMVVSLGCEKLQPERLLPPGSIPLVDQRQAASAEANQLDVVCLQDEAHVGFMSMVDSILRQAKVHLTRLNARQRETVPASELVVGVQCGGSDAFSGVTANPAVGFCTDLLVRAGASVMFSETTEVRDGVAQLTARATTPAVAQQIIDEMAWYDAYLQRGSVDRSANTTPGNKKGGLSNIVEKAMGSIVKSGTSPISGCAVPGRKAQSQRPEGPDLCRHPCQRLHLRHAATGRRHEPARVHHRARHALWVGRMSGDQGRHAQRPGAPLARPDGHQRRRDRRRQCQHRRRGLGDVPPDAGRGQWPQKNLGRTVEAAQRPGAVQPSTYHLIFPYTPLSQDSFFYRSPS
jgi:galactarate dehydratase